MWRILQFGHFEVLMRPDGFPEELGRGAMGITYKALDKNLLSVVVVKAMQNEHLHSEASRKQFFIEAQAMAKIKHPNVPSIYFLGDSAQGCYYAMEYCDGPNLQEYVQAQGPLKAKDAFKIGAQIANALSAVSAAGLVHRDIKPSNLLVTKTSNGTTQIKLIDFGLARNFSIDRIQEKERFAGTPTFASPEQFDPHQALDVRADIYSLGMVIWFLLTGEAAYKGKLLDLMQAQAHDPLPWYKLPDLPERCKNVLAKALEKNPEQRFRTANDFEEAILGALESEALLPLVLEVHTFARNEKSGAVIGDFPYEILDQLDETQSGKRFTGRELSSGRIHTLCLLHPRYGAHPRMLEVIQVIRRKTRHGTHPHLLRISAQSHFQERLVYAFDRDISVFQNLEQWCYEHRAASLEVHFHLLSKIADAVDFASELGLLYISTKLSFVWVVGEGVDSMPYLEPLDPELIFETAIDEASLIRRYLDLVIQTVSLTDHKKRESILQSIRTVAENRKLSFFDSCREILEAVVEPFDISLPDPDYALEEASHYSLDTLEQGRTQPRAEKGENPNIDASLPGLGDRMSSIWSEIISPSAGSPKTLNHAATKIPSRILTVFEELTANSLSEVSQKPNGIKKALDALEGSAEWLNRKKAQLEDQLQIIDEAWNREIGELEQEQSEIAEWRRELDELRDKARDLKQRQLDIAQAKFLQLHYTELGAHALTEEDGDALEQELAQVEKAIATVESKIREHGHELFRKAQSVQRLHEDEKMDQDVALDLLKDEAEAIDKKRSELEILLRQHRENRKWRVVGWWTTGVLALGASSLAAYYVKGRLHDLREVPGEQAWGLLLKERSRAESEKDWASVIHWTAVTQRKAQEDAHLAGFLQRDLSLFQDQIQTAIEKLRSESIDETKIDKAALIHDLKDLSQSGFESLVSPLLTQIEIHDYAKAKNWAGVISTLNEFVRTSGFDAAKPLLGNVRESLLNLVTHLREQKFISRPAELRTEINSMLLAVKESIGSRLIQEVELGLGIETALAEKDRLSALQQFVELGRLLKDDKKVLADWQKRFEPLLTDRSLPSAQLFIEHTLWAEISRLWKVVRPLEILANTFVQQSENGVQRPLLPESTRVAYLKMAVELGSETAKAQLAAEDQIQTSQQGLIREANAWLSGDESVGSKVDLQKAKGYALKIFDHDSRKWMMLGLIAGSEAQTIGEESKQVLKIYEASGYFLTASSLGYPKGYFYAAKCYQGLGDEKVYLALLEMGADAGDADSAYQLGVELVEKNEQRSMQWLIRAAGLGHALSIEHCKKFKDLMIQRGFGPEIEKLKL